MKKIFQFIGLISLICFSFFVTEKTAIVVNNMDDIMIKIKENYKKYNTKSIDATINNNTIIPGINGKMVDINKSYKAMKNIGYYKDSLYVYDYIKPKVSLSDNTDKYIIKGNPNKRMISIIFTVYGDEDISEVLEVINNYNVKANFFVDPTWFTNNNNLIQEIINKGHNIGVLMDDYSNPQFEWMDMVIKRINKQSIGFCYSENDNKENNQECKLKNNYMIRPKKISNNTPLLDIKNNLEVGDILSLPINSEVKRELSTIIIYIKSKGFEINNLENHILE